MWVLAILLSCALPVAAQETVHKFVVGGDVRPPVSVSTSRGTLSVVNGTVVEGNFTVYSATDALGRKVVSSVSVSTSTGKAVVRTYTYKSVYEESKSPYDEDTQAQDDSPSIPSSGNIVRDNTERLVSSGLGGIGGVDWSGAHVQFNLGVSRMFGEYLELRVTTDDEAAFALYGGVGKDWAFKGDNSDRVLWFAGLGFAQGMGDGQLMLGPSFSENAVCEGFSLQLDVDYRYYLGERRRFGFFGGTSLGIGRFRDCISYDSEHEKFPGKFVWDLRCGISLRF